MQEPFSQKQLEFITKATKKWNLAHGSVRSGKTVCTTFAFMHAVDQCTDSDLYIVGHSSDTAFRNIVRPILHNPEFSIFRPFCSWSPGKHELKYKDKTIRVLGALNEGAIGNFQGNTWSLGLCDEITLYPESIIDMIDTRLSKPHSRGFASMNPSTPDHKVKKWIDAGEEGDPNYFSLHFTLDDNPFLEESYKQRIRDSLSGIFYKRNYLGEWCLAEGVIYDFFDKSIYVLPRPPRAAEYFIAAIDYGVNNSFACLVIGVDSGHRTQLGVCRWVQDEYYWDSNETHRQKTNLEYANEVEKFLEPYGVRMIYVDPSAASFKVELNKKGMRVVDAQNDVLDGIYYTASEMKQGNLFILGCCKNLIREMSGYCWDSKAAKLGEDRPLKKNDHALDALRYGVFSHKIAPYQPYAHSVNDYHRNRFVR